MIKVVLDFLFWIALIFFFFAPAVDFTMNLNSDGKNEIKVETKKESKKEDSEQIKSDW